MPSTCDLDHPAPTVDWSAPRRPVPWAAVTVDDPHDVDGDIVGLSLAVDDDGAPLVFGASIQTSGGPFVVDLNAHDLRYAALRTGLDGPRVGDHLAVGFGDAAETIVTSMRYTPVAPVPEIRNDAAPNRRPNRLRPHLYDWLALAKLPDPEPMIGGLLYFDTLAMVYGPTSAGKSFVSLGMALSVATGTPWHGHATAQAPTLYVVGEGLAGVEQRIEAWTIAAGMWVPPTDARFLAVAPNLRDPDDVDDLTELAKENGVRFIVIDTLSRAIPGVEENAASDMSEVVAMADRLRRATGACVCAVHHAGYDRSHARGSTALQAGLDTVLHVQREAEGSPVVVVCNRAPKGKQKDGPEHPDVRLELVPSGDSLVLREPEPAPRHKPGPPALDDDALRRGVLDTVRNLEAHGVVASRSKVYSLMPGDQLRKKRVVDEMVADGVLAEHEGARKARVLDIAPRRPDLAPGPDEAP